MIEPARFDPERTPSIHWADKNWPIPPLTPMQLDMIWDDIAELTPKLRIQDVAELEDILSNDPEAQLRATLKSKERLYSLAAEEYAKMRRVVFYGLTAAHPAIDRETFDMTLTTPTEMLTAFLVVRRQSQMYEKAEGIGAQVGEAMAAKQNGQTGN